MYIDKDFVVCFFFLVDIYIVFMGVLCGNLWLIFVGFFGELILIFVRCLIVLLWKFGFFCEFVIVIFIICFEGCGFVFVFMNKVVGLL